MKKMFSNKYLKKIPIILIIISLLVVSASCKDRIKQDAAINQFLIVKNKAGTMFEDKSFKENRSVLTSMVKRCDEIAKPIYDKDRKAEVLALKALILGMENKFNDAEKALNEAIKNSPRNFKIYMLSGKTYYLKGDLKKSGVQFGLALLYMPEDNLYDRIEAKFYLGDVTEKLKDYAMAQKQYSEIVEIAQNYDIQNKYYKEAKHRLDELTRE